MTNCPGSGVGVGVGSGVGVGVGVGGGVGGGRDKFASGAGNRPAIQVRSDHGITTPNASPSSRPTAIKTSGSPQQPPRRSVRLIVGRRAGRYG